MKITFKYLNLILIILTLLISSCSTITLYNGAENQNEESYQEATVTWHHNFFFGLMEYSDPVQLEKACGEGNKWAAAQTSLGPWQILTNMVTSLVSLGWVYTPFEAKVYCVKK